MRKGRDPLETLKSAGWLAARAGAANALLEGHVSLPHKLPNVLYKYTRARWADAMVQDGAVRVRPARDYAADENKAGQRDANEGVGDYTFSAGIPRKDEVVFFDKEARPSEMESEIVRSLAGKSAAGMAFIDVRVSTRPENALVYCTTMVRDERHYAEFDADTVVRIHDPLGFSVAVTRALFDACAIKEFAWGAKAIAYRPRPFRLGKGMADHPLFIKDVSFKHQQEFRIMWPPANEATGPVDLKVDGLGKFCSIVGSLRP